MDKIAIMGDFHSGAHSGFTPPKFQGRSRRSEEVGRFWDATMELMEAEGPFTTLVLTGDLVDGAAGKSFHRDVWTTAAEDQAECASEALSIIRDRFLVRGGKILGVKGTGYHTVIGGTDAEDLICDNLGIPRFPYELYFEKDGVTFHVRHNIGTRGMPHTSGTQLTQPKMHNLYLNDIGEAPRADVFIRGHVHKHFAVRCDEYQAILCPCLKGPDDEYGGRKCEGTIRMGFLSGWIKDGEFQWTAPRIRLLEKKAEVIKL